jgi:SAM-dependent methyltransferase
VVANLQPPEGRGPPTGREEGGAPDLGAVVRRAGRQLGHTPVGRILGYAISPRARFEARAARDVVASIATDEFLRRRRAWLEDRTLAGRKYLDLRPRVRLAVSRAVEHGLDRSPPRRILDLGCGTGYFLMVARQWGHDVLGLDIDHHEIFNEVTRMAGVPRVVHRIVPFEPLPDLGESFDLITAYMVKFNHRSRDNHWGTAEWDYFLKDCRSRLRPGGTMLLRLNRGKHSEHSFISQGTREQLCRLPGTSVSADGSEVRVGV